MKLKATDQVHISSVKRDPIAAGEEFEVSHAMGKELLAKHPGLFAQVRPQDAKTESTPQNKAEGAAPANKASGRKAKPEG